MSWDASGSILIIFIVVAVYLILPWINLVRTNIQSEKINQLIKRIRKLEELLEETPIKIKPKKEEARAESVVTPKVQEKTPQEAKPKPKIPKQIPETIIASSKKSSKGTLESQLGMRLPVWIGGIALALGGFFLVKWSIDVGLLSPTVRVFLAFILGSGLVLAGQKIIPKVQREMSLKISQSLTGAGLATLYGTFYSATTLYDLIPTSLGFLALIATTALGILLSLRQGIPIAVLSLAGGFVTPMLVSSDSPSAVILFGYLYLLFAALTILSRHRNWWWLIGLAGLASYMWVGFWISIYGVYADLLWLSLFVLAVTFSNLFSIEFKEEPSKTISPPLMSNRVISLVGILLYSYIVTTADFPSEQLWMYLVLVFAGFVLTYFKSATYTYFTPLTLAATTPLLMSYWPQTEGQYLFMWLSYAVIYLGGTTILLRKYIKPFWAGQLFAASLIFYGLLYNHFSIKTLIKIDDFLWASLALVFAIYAVALTGYIKSIRSDTNAILAWLSAIATTFVSIALALVLSTTVFRTALAFEMLALYWLAHYLKMNVLRSYALVIGGLFLALSIDYLLNICLAVFVTPLIGQADMGDFAIGTITFDSNPFIGILLPAIAFLLSSFYETNDQTIEKKSILQSISYFLITLATVSIFRKYYLYPTDVYQGPISLIEGGLILNLYLAMGCGFLYLYSRTQEKAAHIFGLGLTYFAPVNIIYTYIFISNPAITGVQVAGIPILNNLFLIYGTPIAWFWLASTFARSQEINLKGLASFLTFTFITISVRSFYHLPDLSTTPTTNAEIYTYSVVWLIYSLVLLFYGVLKENSILRFASLALILVTVGKVFLYDASALEGIFRVLSFLGLGLSLIGISYVYSRFVFPSDKDK